MTAFLWIWLATQAVGVGLVWLFTVALGRPARRAENSARRGRGGGEGP